MTAFSPQCLVQPGFNPEFRRLFFLILTRIYPLSDAFKPPVNMEFYSASPDNRYIFSNHNTVGAIKTNHAAYEQTFR